MQKNITENTCRVCLTEQEILINLFDEVEDFHTKLSDLLEYCGDLKVDLSDNYPKLICGNCTSELLVAAKFREKCKRTREILSQFIPAESTCESDIAEDELDLPVIETDETGTCLADSETDIKKELTEDSAAVDQDEEDVTVENSQVEVITADVFEHVEFLEANESGGHYLILEDGGEGPQEESVSTLSNEPNDDLEKLDENQDQDLYERIIRAANSAAKFTPKQQILAKPLIINCKCDICGAGFTHQNNLRRHLQKHRNTLEMYSCSICSIHFTSYKKLEDHGKYHAEIKFIKENNFAEKESSGEVVCLVEKSLSSNIKRKIDSGDLETEEIVTCSKDMNDTKAIKKNHKCSHCEKRFVSKSALSAHLRIHTGDRPFECTECTKTFTTQGGLVLHMRRHTGLRPFSCNVCGKRFVESSNLKVHMRIHTGEKPHKCTICGRSFARVFLLQIHQRTHTGERPYQCPYCEKAFAQQGDLASHKRIHTGERPHKCPYCPKGFIKSSALTQHLRKHSKFENGMGRGQEDTDNGFCDIKKEENQMLRNFDILIVEDEETVHSGAIGNNNDRRHELGVIVECPEAVESN